MQGKKTRELEGGLSHEQSRDTASLLIDIFLYAALGDTIIDLFWPDVRAAAILQLLDFIGARNGI